MNYAKKEQIKDDINELVMLIKKLLKSKNPSDALSQLVEHLKL